VIGSRIEPTAIAYLNGQVVSNEARQRVNQVRRSFQNCRIDTVARLPDMYRRSVRSPFSQRLAHLILGHFGVMLGRARVAVAQHAADDLLGILRD
jgi:hypothetical protein